MEVKVERGEMVLLNGKTTDGQMAMSGWEKLDSSVDMDIQDNMAYQISFPAVRDHRERMTIFSLRDGCLAEGDTILSLGVVIRFNIADDKQWRKAVPFIRYFDETDSQWKNKDMRRDTVDARRVFISSHELARRMVFVIGDRNDPNLWLRDRRGPDFIVSFPGTYEILTSGNIIQISNAASLEQLGSFQPSTEVKATHNDEGGPTKIFNFTETSPIHDFVGFDSEREKTEQYIAEMSTSVPKQ